MQGQFSRSFKRRLVTGVLALCVLMGGGTSGVAEDNPEASIGQRLLEKAGIAQGVCSVLGVDAELAIDLARESQLLLHVLQADASEVDKLRARAKELGYGIDRLVVQQGTLEELPYADNMVDIVLIPRAVDTTLNSLAVKEVHRVLRPRGVAVIQGDSALADRLKIWIAAETFDEVESTTDEHGAWIKIRKPMPAGTDEWTHWEKSPDNNPVSTDQVIRAPYMTQFMSGPFYIGMPSITTAAGGRTFLAIGHIAHHRREWDMLNKLVARNGYNGTVLWDRALPEGYLVHRSAFIATRDTFYMIDGEGTLMLDAETGDERGRIQIPGVRGDWKWMAMHDGVLYVLAGRPEPKTETMKGDRTFGGWSWDDLSRGYYGKRIPFGFGDVLAAYSLKDQKTLWIHREDSLIDSRAMAIQGGKTFLYCPDRHLRALDNATGHVAWTNAEESVLSLIERPGQGLRSTPGFRTACINVATPQALVIQGQTRMNVVGISTLDGKLLWQKKKFTNNPNAIYVDGNVVLGVGERGSHVAIEPATGDVVEDYKFHKANCTRLTASEDSFFCRGEGTLRFDRETKKVLVDGGVRPGCNDGAIPAHGLLYIGPWQCDCNLSLIGQVTKCAAGDFQFDVAATDTERLTTFNDNTISAERLGVTDRDWPTLRRDNHRSASTSAPVATSVKPRWRVLAEDQNIPTAPVAAGDLVFVAGSNGTVRAADAETGELRWSFDTNYPIKEAPTVWNGRLYFGCADGHVYCLDAATGHQLWKFRAAPAERQIMVYGHLSSTWPVHTGVLIDNETAYFAAGIIDQDGTYLYALDAKTGSIKWQNNSSGHIDQDLRKGISAQGNLSIKSGQLLLAGGNQVSPARFNLETGECLTKSLTDGRPKANNGRFVGVFHDVAVINGGRILHSAAENVSTKGYFAALTDKNRFRMNNGGIPPAWDNRRLAVVNFRHGKLTCLDAEKVAQRMREGFRNDNRPRDDRAGWLYGLALALQQDGAALWQTDLGQPNKFEVVSIAVCPNAVVVAVGHQVRFRAQPQWFAVALDAKDGKQLWKQELRGKPLPGGLLVDRSGQVITSMLGGDLVCLGPSSDLSAQSP